MRSKKEEVKTSSGLQTVKINANFIGLDYKALKSFLTFFENILIIIGTSLQVYPAAGFIQFFQGF